MNRANVTVLWFFVSWVVASMWSPTNASDSETQQVSKAIAEVHISVTTNEQQRFGGLQMSIGNLNVPAVGLKERAGTTMTLPVDHVYLLMQLDVLPLPGRTAKGGKDIYLIDAGGEKHIGYDWFLSGWIEADAADSMSFEKRRTKKFLYVVPKDKVSGSVFHFLGVNFNVADYLAK